MHTLNLRKWSLLGALALVPACGDDKGNDEGSETTNSTPSTATDANTDPGTGTAGETGTATDDPTTNTPTTNEPTTDEPTGDPTATDPTTDPTAGDDGQFCQEVCSVDADCTVMGADSGLKCVESRCTSDFGKCDSDAACQATVSGWITSCASDAECLMGQLCIDVGGKGLCATAPGMLTCEQLMQSEVTVQAIGGGDVTVCANTDYVCNDQGFCENPCEDNAECAIIPGYPQCNLDTGTCECTSDADCAATNSPSTSVCNNGVCGCGSDADCAGTNTDVCNANGFCGCSDASVCTTKSFDGTMSVCEGF